MLEQQDSDHWNAQPGAEAGGAATQEDQAQAWSNCYPAHRLGCLTRIIIAEKFCPRLYGSTVKKIQLAMDVSQPYATLVKRSLKIPHPRHWFALAQLAGIFG